ncbi:MAG: Cardiolipin synthase [Candidatus Celerinatantimonas neptuna]|nr:MAG: Cardiolipin synthase [Candidatus Celerinatantimonas neptuna]
MRFSWLLLALFSVGAQAKFMIPGFELVHTVPVETSLETPDLREPVQVWCQQFDKAKRQIDIAQFYATSKKGEPLEKVMSHLREAGERGVHIRFLMDAHGVSISDPKTIEQLKSIPHLTFKLIDYHKVSGGIIHAKYFVVDGKSAYMGSQNFDWRSLKEIHETGLLITDAKVVKQLQAIFDIDWHLQQQLAQGKPLLALNQHVELANEHELNYLVASPNAYNPPGVGDSQSELPRLLAKAKKSVRIMVMTYAPLSYSTHHPRPYYALIDTAIRAAAQRGVKIQLMVSNWNTGHPDIDYLKSLDVLPNIEVKIVTIPQSKSGFIPYARVLHSKTMDIDNKIAWVGTSNWEGGYMDNSRNLEIVMQNETMAERIGELHEQLWNSPYAKPFLIDKDYPQPHPGHE